MKPTTLISPGQLLIEAIAVDAPPSRIAQTLADALSADLHNRDGSISPDHKTRISAAQILLHFSVGKPTERIESISVNLDAESSIGLAERLKNSPALRRSLRTILESVEPTVDLKNSL
jgi:hypothetical protein